MDLSQFDPTVILAALALVILVITVAAVTVVVARRRQKRPSKPEPAIIAPRELSVERPRELSVERPRELSDEERITRGLGRTKTFFQQALDRVFTGGQGERFFGDVEETLLGADIGIEFTERVVSDLKKEWGVRVPVRAELRDALSRILVSQLPDGKDRAAQYESFSPTARPHVVMVVGVNGSGKTTTVAKLCGRFRAQGLKVLVGGADTFRAAANEQLRTWVERVGGEGVFQKEGADPSAVAFDTVQAAGTRGADVCLIDTAGRLHTKANLMEELKKMKRVIGKAMPGAPQDVWIVLDGTMGQNSLNQAREFHQHLGLTGIIVTKLDSSAKGGAVLAVTSELKVPVLFIGVGESAEDLVPFQGRRFVEAILAGV